MKCSALGKWRYHYPEFDKTQNYVKMQPQDLV